MRLTVIIGLLAILCSVASEGHKRKKYYKRRGASHYDGSYRRGQYPRSNLGRHGPFGLHGPHTPPRRFRPTHDDYRRPWRDSYESREASSEYDRRIDHNNSWESSSEGDWRSRTRPPCTRRRCSPRKPPCQRTTTPPPTRTSPTEPTKDWWAVNILKPTAGYWETVLSWPTTRPTTRQTREPVASSDMNVTTVRPEETTIAQHILDCVGNCTTTPEFQPVCGTDSVTYDNIGRLFCAKTCGINVELRRTSICPPPPFPDYEDDNENGRSDGDVSDNGDENRSGNDDDGETGPPTTPPPPPTLNPRFFFQTTLLTRFQQCMKICPITLDYKPVCGTDLVTYFNVDRMICARECGQDVKVLCDKPCSVCTWRTTSTTITTTPRTLPQATTTYRTIGQSTVRVNDGRTTRASMELCIRSCPITSEQNPVCGTNNVNYSNPGHLLCAQMCGEDVKVSKFTPCSSTTEAPTTTTVDDYDDETLPPHIVACTSTCRTTPEYNPVCGSNGGTYYNLGRLECDKYCGVDVQLSYKGLCRGFLPPILTSLVALAKITTPIWKTSTLSTPTTSSTPLKVSMIQSEKTQTTSSITLKTPITSPWNSPTTPTITETPITSPWNTPKTFSTTLETPITSAWNTPPTSSTVSNVLKTSSWNTPTTPPTLLLDSPTTTPLTTESTILSTLFKDSSITLVTLRDSPVTTPSTASWDSLSTTVSPYSSDIPSTTPSIFSIDPSTTPMSWDSTTPSMSSQDSPTTNPSTTTWESPTTMPLTSSLASPLTTPSSSKLLTTSTGASSTSWATETPTSEIMTTVDFTISPDILASIFNLPPRVETNTQPNIVTSVADEDFSLDPRFGENLEENAKRNKDDMASRIVFPDDR